MCASHVHTVPGRALHLNVRAGFVAQGTSLGRWCRDHGIRRQNAEKALNGVWTGPGARKLCARLVEAANVPQPAPPSEPERGDAESIMRLFRLYAAHRGLALSTVSTYAAAAGDFYARLERGHDLTTRRAARVTQWLSDRWPADLDWPADIPRPPPAEPDRGEAA